MKVSGSATLHAPVERVWAALNDPAVLVRTIPGCQRLEEVERDAFRMTVTAGVASIKGSYAGDVRLVDQREPHGFVLKASGAGAPGTVAADVTVRLVPGADGTTLLSYDADAIVGGAIGGVGQRILAGVAKKTALEFFSAVDQVLAGVPEPAGAAAPAGGLPASGAAADRVAVSGAAAAGAPLRGVFEAPAAASVGVAGRGRSEFVRGAVFGAAVALLGAAVGGWAAGRRPTPAADGATRPAADAPAKDRHGRARPGVKRP